MARIVNTLFGRLVLLVLGVHAVLLPALFFSLFHNVANIQKSVFVDYIRASSRTLADIVETSGVLGSDFRTIDFLDSAFLTGTGVYAEVQIGDRRLTSSVMDEAKPGQFKEDFAFGEHGDDVYYISVPLYTLDVIAVLRLGFDENPTLEQIRFARNRGIGILSGYLIVSLLLVALLSALLTRPLRRLQEDSRRIASGDYDLQLHTESRLQEIDDLVEDLNIMRSNLVASNIELQQEISDRETAERQKEQLEAQLHRSQRLESIGTLAGGIAHEFNNILLPIMLYTDLALEDLPEDSPIAARLHHVSKSAIRAKKLIEQILTFSRQGEKQNAEPTPIAPTVEEALVLMRALVPATIDIQVKIDPSCGLVKCHADQVQQLVVNLCTNAYKSMNATGGHLGVRVEPVYIDELSTHELSQLNPGNYIKLSVSDTGVGMDTATQTRIFEPFFTTRGVGEGAGLGLSVAHGIAVGVGGGITVETEPGKGSIFHVYLPQAD